MEFKFIGNPVDPRDNRGEVTFYGIRFPLNIPVKVDNPVAIQKLMGNSHFAICGSDGKTHVAMAPKSIVLPKEPSLIVTPRAKRNRKVAEERV